MNSESEDLWQRALQALGTATALQGSDPDAAASRAYYAAFYAVSSWFCIAGRTFTRHSAVEAAVHRDVVKAGLTDGEFGKRYSFLQGLRSTADYGGRLHVSKEEARQAVQAAELIIAEVRRLAASAGMQLP